MPEEKKKENFTFSDKIKDSKPAASKSFANRVSSRIGRDGKPKQTIFERTKRDAPFLIAALVALLLLPFLYKYSGSVKEEAVVTPASSESIFDPERYAFSPDVENPEGEISQLSARDPLDLIKGWGSSEEKYEASDQDTYDYNEDLYKQRDAYRESEAASAKKSAVDTNVDIEENTTNIYKKRAVAGARHSFKRAATKINPITRSNRSGADGRPLGVGNWGGALKNAAKKVKGDTPKDSPKPVSLQPLQAAGKPARANFGDAAAAMRKAKDALGKHDAERAILDAQVKPVDPGSIGGMTFGDAKFGGGAGKVERKFNYQPQTPWWWDLMKTRSQMAWQKKFEWKWGIYDWMTKLAENILGKLLNCLITGNDGGDVDHFLGTAAGEGKDPKCCGEKEEAFFTNHPQYRGKTFEKACKDYKSQADKKEACDKAGGWEAGSKASVSYGFFGTRAHCLGLAVRGKYKSEDNELNCQCDDPTFGAFHIKTYGEVSEWVNKKHVYHWVVARNTKIKVGNKEFDLCNESSSITHFNEEQGAGSGSSRTIDHNRETPLDKKQAMRGTTNAPRTDEYMREYMADAELANSCIVYVAQGTFFDEPSMITLVREMLGRQLGYLGKNEKYVGAKLSNDELKDIDSAFNQIQFWYIEGGAMKKPLGNRDMIWADDRTLPGMPIMYKHFYASFVTRENVRLNRKDNVADNKVRAQNEYKVCQRGCEYNPLAHLLCLEDEDGFAKIVVRKSLAGQEPTDFRLQAEFIPAEKVQEEGEEGQNPPTSPQGRTLPATRVERSNNLWQVEVTDDMAKTGGNIVWTGTYMYEGQLRTFNRKVCEISGGTNNRVPPGSECLTMHDSKDCCDQMHESYWAKWKYEDGKCQEDCVDEHQSKTCCEKLMPGWLYNEETRKCENKPNPATGKIRFAPILSWVPSNQPDCRENAETTEDVTKDKFTNCEKIQGIQENKREFCGDQGPMVMDSNAAREYALGIAKAYNAQHPDRPLAEEFKYGNWPTDGEFVDALYIAREIGDDRPVPGDAVCELGRDMVRMSRDPHVGNKEYTGETLYKREQNSLKTDQHWHNELGAFLAYIDTNAQLYPAKNSASHTGKEELDMRFTPKVLSSNKQANAGQLCDEAGCYKKPDENHATCWGKYHYNNYARVNLGERTVWQSAYEHSLQKLKLPTNNLPLAALAQVNNIAGIKHTDCGLKNANCGKRAADYRAAVKALLTENANFKTLEGKACSVAAEYSLKRDDVIRYVEGVCENGLDRKPHGVGSYMGNTKKGPYKGGENGNGDDRIG